MSEDPRSRQVKMLQLCRGTHKTVPRCPVHGVVPQIALNSGAKVYVFCAIENCNERL